MASDRMTHPGAGERRRGLNLTMVASPTDDEGPNGRTWRSTALRVRCADISEPLSRLGHRVKLIHSNRIEARRQDGSWYDGDVYLFYQTLEDYRDLADDLRARGKIVVVDLCDDVFNMAGRIGLAGELAMRASAVTVPTLSLAKRFMKRLRCPIHVVPDGIEGARGIPAAPRSRGALRLLWYGWQHKIGAVADGLEALARFARDRRRILLSCVTNLAPIQPDLARVMRGGTEDLSVRVFAWRQDIYLNAFAEADLVIVPSGASLRESGASPIRMAQALWSGRLPIVERTAGYLTAEFAPFGCFHDSLTDGIAWAMEHPRQVMDRIVAAQRQIESTRSPGALARDWHRALTAIVEQSRASAAPETA